MPTESPPEHSHFFFFIDTEWKAITLPLSHQNTFCPLPAETTTFACFSLSWNAKPPKAPGSKGAMGPRPSKELTKLPEPVHHNTKQSLQLPHERPLNRTYLSSCFRHKIFARRRLCR
eukprot:2371131-Amphidinium_carterae.1